jgi:hypothetical protein
VLYALSVLHVMLELPLNHQTFRRARPRARGSAGACAPQPDRRASQGVAQGGAAAQRARRKEQPRLRA